MWPAVALVSVWLFANFIICFWLWKRGFNSGYWDGYEVGMNDMEDIYFDDDPLDLNDPRDFH